jgi:hypothetical protein
MNCIDINGIKVNGNRMDFYFNITGNVQKYFKKRNHLYYEYNYEVWGIPESILVIPFLANIIPLVWITDSTIKIPYLDKSFYDCLDRVKSAYQKMYPRIKFSGTIKVDNIEENFYEPEYEAAQLFSGGLDALATFIRIKEKRPILITEYGWHENEIQLNDVWESDRSNTREFAMKYGLDNIFVQSNYGTFLNPEVIDRDYKKRLGDNWWHGLHHGLAIISAAIPMAYKLKVKTVYIASSFHKGYQATCASDPSVDNELRFASGSVFHDAYELTRQEKVKVVTDFYGKNDKTVKVRVCFKNSENCCFCEKCLRTILGIIAEGKNPKDFDFNIPDDLSKLVKNFLVENVKYFSPSKIHAWNVIIDRMKDNANNVQFSDLLDWFLDYDLVLERRKSLIKYRTTKVVPIIKRRIITRIKSLTQKSK